jgi:DNA-binding transcriptional LysR family regulator
MSDRLPEELACAAVFVRVIDAGSFSAAARSLGTTKSAVSKQVARLENLLGLQLLRRTTRSIGLTQPGQEYFQQVSPAITQFKAAQSAVADLTGHARGLLKVTCPITFGRACIAPLLPEFLRLNPELELQLILVDRPVDLAQEGFDLAIRIGRELADGVVARKLADFEYVLCGSAAAWPPGARLRDPEALARIPCLRYGDGESSSIWQFSSGGRVRRVRVRGPLLVNNSELLRNAVLEGVGVALLPNYVVADDLKTRRLVRLLPMWKSRAPFGTSAHLVWLPVRTLPLKTRVFADFLLERFT